MSAAIVSPSAELVVSRDCSGNCVVRDTMAAGEDRFRWTVAVLGDLMQGVVLSEN
jgi:hypothetical protein